MACACSAWAGAVREQGGGKEEEKNEERRREKEMGKKKRRERKTRKRRERKGDAGGIRGFGREPSVASTRSNVHEKRGEQGKFKRCLILVSGRRFVFWCPGDELPEKIRARR